MKENLIDSKFSYFHDIPESKNWVELLRISEEDPREHQYSARSKDGKQYYVRLDEPTRYDRIKGEFEHLRTVYETGVPVPSPKSFGLCDKGRRLYLLTDWIGGRSGEQILDCFDACSQYELGVSAGLYIKMIHAVRAPNHLVKAWWAGQSKRWQKIRQDYQQCQPSIPYGLQLFKMIDENLHLLQNRPQCLLHGAFHTGNIMLTQEGNLKLVNFHRWLYGDPLYDLSAVMSTTGQRHKAFAVGVLDCYFAYSVDEPSLRLMNIYAGLALVERAIDVSLKALQPENIIEAIHSFACSLQGCRQVCPTWYKRAKSAISGS
ncbi:MAG: aminoglycoside phosphotransferase family protein [Clostridiaceae bacterium]|nr:aminoglycoside phosphotransferase family protein [Clostridiaceae bacterium]